MLFEGFTQIFGHFAANIEKAHKRTAARRTTALGNDNGWVGCHAFKYLDITEIDHGLNLRIGQQVAAQVFSRTRLEKRTR